MRKHNDLSLGKSLILIILLVLQLTACSKSEDAYLKEDEKMKGTLSVYYMDFGDQTVMNPDYTYELTLLLQKFQDTYPDVKILATTFGNNKSFMDQVATEVSSGKGPDLFLQNYGSPMDWHKMANNGNYENLSPYISYDKTYNESDYFEAALKSGQIENKQYILPLAFDSVSLLSRKNQLAEHNIKFADNPTYEDVLSAIDISIQQGKENKDIIPLGWMLGRNDFLTAFMEAFGMPFVDYKMGSASIDKASFYKLCETVKGYYPYALAAFANKDNNYRLTQNAKNVILTLSNEGYIVDAVTQEAMMEKLGDESVILSMPKYDDPAQITAQVRYYAAINGNSKNKQLAYDSAKALMDLASEKNINYNISINRQRFDEYLSSLAQNPPTTYIDNDIVAGEFDAEKVKAAVEKIQYVTANDIAVLSIVKEGMLSYIEGTKSFDDCYDETVNKLKLYINE